MDELGTQLVPWRQHEFSHARNRPANERPPHPKVGEQVWYRRYDWNTHPETAAVYEPVLVTVVEAQAPDDTSLVHYAPDVGPIRDPNLWHLVRDVYGRPVYDAGVLRYAPVADPWPWLRLRGEWPVWPGAQPSRQEGITREARLRGSAGWLPLDYRTRPERWRLPHETALVERPPLAPLSEPAFGTLLLGS